MKKYLINFFLISMSFLLTSCASIIIKDLSKSKENPIKSQEQNSLCIEEWDIAFETRSASIPNDTNSEAQFVAYNVPELIDAFKSKWKDQNIKNEKCSTPFKGAIEVIDSSVNGKPGWAFFSILTIGIIPYWEERTQRITIFKIGGDGNRTMLAEDSSFYTVYWSLLLWPAVPFFDSAGSYEIFKSSIHRVIEKIK